MLGGNFSRAVALLSLEQQAALDRVRGHFMATPTPPVPVIPFVEHETPEEDERANAV